MDKEEHGRRLKAAMARQRMDRQAVADFVGVKPRTITNWTTGTTMPDDGDRVALRELFPGYDDGGDQVESAVRSSELIEWRQDAVLSTYKKHLHEQRAEQVG